MKTSVLLLAVMLSASGAAPGAETGLTVSNATDRLLITDSGKPVAAYVFADKAILRPYFANLCGPGGIQVTRNHPPQQGQDATDHDTMHPGVWLAFGDLSGQDFWRNKAVIRHKRFVEPVRISSGRLTFVTENELQTGNGEVLATQLSRIALIPRPGGYLLIWDATFTPGGHDIFFGDQEEMGLGVRLATPITEKNGGVILGSTTAKGAAATWGKAFDWCDYSGQIAGQHAGVTLMPDPANFRPSWFHNRDYGLMVANPFGRKAMNQGEISRLEVRKGQSLRLRFGVWLHAREAPEPGAAYRAFLEELRTAPAER